MVKQNAVRIRHATTGFEFLGLIPFYSMVDKRLNRGGGISFDFDGSINIRIGESRLLGEEVGIHPGEFSDSEFFLRYLKVLCLIIINYTDEDYYKCNFTITYS